jgi:hypothetical protein
MLSICVIKLVQQVLVSRELGTGEVLDSPSQLARHLARLLLVERVGDRDAEQRLDHQSLQVVKLAVSDDDLPNLAAQHRGGHVGFNHD